MNKNARLFTIGYQGTTVPAFLSELVVHGVTLLVDVRRIASSRRPGFAKSALAANLATRNIAYRHLRDLGTPADGRAAARAGDHETMREIFAAHLATMEATDGLYLLKELVSGSETVCILCFEHEPTHCHRLLISDALQNQMNLEVVHLLPGIEAAD